MDMELQIFLQLVISGLALGSIYALIALGFVLIYKGTDVLNFAQGEVMMVGTVFCFALVTWAHCPLWLAAVLAFGFALLLGATIERLVIQPMIGESAFASVMVTIGLSSMLYSGAAMAFGRDVYNFPSPFSADPIAWRGLVIDPANLWTLVLTAVIVATFAAVFRYSRLGIAFRAIAQDSHVASLMGIRVKRIYALIWAVGAAVATCGGWFLACMTETQVDMARIGLRAFPAAVLGGIDSIAGALVGGLIIGVVENLAGGYLSPYLGGGIKEVTGYVVLLIILLIRPYGLFGTKEIERV